MKEQKEPKHDLLALFEECLSADYISTEESGNYAVKEENGRLTFFFEWSDGCEDWRNNLDFPVAVYKETGKHWYCHRGFLKVFKGILPHIEEKIRHTDAKEVLVVGYSHGAAIATMVHEYIFYNRPDLRENLWGYGFGCPRCFWGFLPSKEVQGRWARFFPIRNIDDLVTHLPPAVFGYRHVHSVYTVGKRGKYRRVEAHRPENYQRELKNRKEARLEALQEARQETLQEARQKPRRETRQELRSTEKPR